MNWIALIIGLIKLALAVESFFRRRGLVNNAEASLVARILAERSYAIDKGNAARLI